ncbi:hypothetical protein [Kitasatospora sp. LaBMicrA B282]|uniref:hypothetical protein n=1 Tax=Kitasatospora sp. LaBMicrA B282 TaxID=3420949 RepID=UPI003D0CB72B
MNSLKGLGICALLAGVAFALTRVADPSRLFLGISVSIIGVSLTTYAASIKRRRRDRRAAGE